MTKHSRFSCHFPALDNIKTHIQCTYWPPFGYLIAHKNYKCSGKRQKNHAQERGQIQTKMYYTLRNQKSLKIKVEYLYFKSDNSLDFKLKYV